jgi:putative membrane-bound dehydrogenase-like protein
MAQLRLMESPRMIRISLAIVVSLGMALSARAAEFKVNGRTFTLPDGFTIELAAGPPLVDRPIVADLDEQGRLYVADSSGSNEKVQKQLVDRTHRIVRLEDTNGDGRYDKQTVFADRMMFPEGAMWRDGSLYVAAPPSIWKLTDTDGDGVADQRVEWFQGKTLTGCANDLHGPYLGPDGWIYWCKGAFAPQSYARPGKAPFSTRAAHIFRSRPDGTGIEPVMTGGMDNPVDVVFTPEGERIFTTTFLQNPGGGRRDGLIHAIYGGVYGKIHDVIDDHPQTGPDVMPILSHLGPAAPCGLTRYESEVFGTEFRDNLFACQFNLRKVSRHVLTRSGSAYVSDDRDFLSSTDLDFHPTDVHEDADGSLIVVDTGGWYKLCCPTSQLEKPDVLGAIYRIRKTGAKSLDDPRGRLLAWDSMTIDAKAALLRDDRPAVRRRAIALLAKEGNRAVATLSALALSASDGTNHDPRPDAVWALTRIESDEARSAVRAALGSDDATVRAVALQSISLYRDAKALPMLLKTIKSGSPMVRRLAVEAIGRIGDKTAVPALLDLAGERVDRPFEHAVIYALIEIDDPASTLPGIQRGEAGVRRAALIALDQMPGGGVRPEVVAADLASADRTTRETAAWIVGRHPEWGGALAGTLAMRLRSDKLTETDREELVTQLGRFAKSAEVERLLSAVLLDPKAAESSRVISLRAMSRAGLKEAPAGWVDALRPVLSSGTPLMKAEAVATARGLTVKGVKAEELGTALRQVAESVDLPVSVRVGALAAVPGGLASVSPALFAMLRDELNPDRPVATRLLASDVIAGAKLSREQLLELTDTLATAGPLEVGRLLAAYEASSDEALGLRLIGVLKRSTAVSALRPEMIRPRIEKYGAAVKRDADSLYAMLDVDASKQKVKLDELAASLPSGEIRRGQAVFNGTKAACITCHALGYVGGNIGPDLSRIGSVRADRDLLEAIVYPSASFVRSFEPVLVATKEGKSINGLVRKDASDEVVLTTGPNQEVRIARDEIEEMRPGTVSIMPAGLDQQLSRQELADLIAFLKSRK